MLDGILGDPVWLYHPVRLMGGMIQWMEKALRRIFGNSDRGLFAAGILLCVSVTGVFAGIPAVLLRVLGRNHPHLGFALECFWSYQLLAARSLREESRKVYRELKKGDLENARRAVSMIVGRDTQDLTMAGVTRAAVETVAENTTDGVTAPLLFMLLGGPAAGFFYKAINTMDSMVGYRNERYRYFGRAAAKLDDILNYIPARISAALMIVSAKLLGLDAENARRIYRRDRNKHASPNSAHTEAVCAGALNVRLAGDAFYFGKLYEKPYIGDDTRPIEPEDILRAARLMEGTAALTLAAFGGIRILAAQIAGIM